MESFVVINHHLKSIWGQKTEKTPEWRISFLNDFHLFEIGYFFFIGYKL